LPVPSTSHPCNLCPSGACVLLINELAGSKTRKFNTTYTKKKTMEHNPEPNLFTSVRAPWEPGESTDWGF